MLLKIPELLRDDWPLGKVIKVFKDLNEVIRSLEVSVRGEINRRSIEFIVPLELSCENIPPPGRRSKMLTTTTTTQLVEHPLPLL